MDALKRPLFVPPEFSVYAEEKGVFHLYQSILSQLVIHKPKDPLTFIAQYLAKPTQDPPRLVVYGPPTSGQYTISKLAAQKLNVVHVNPQRLLVDEDTVIKEARDLQVAGESIPPELWARLIAIRLEADDCTSKGWVLEGFPRTREQALALKAAGVLPKHFIHLSAPNNVLHERYSGKRVDSLSGDVYHLLFHPPDSSDIASRLIEEPNGKQAMMEGLDHYHRYSSPLLDCYSTVSKTFNADQPLDDLFEEVTSYLSSEPRSAAPHTPRILLLGPTGAGKTLQALHLARTYNIVSVDARELIRRTINSGSNDAVKMKPFYERGMMIPDDMVISLLSQRLSRLDATSRGWVLHGYPLTRDQADLLTKVAQAPNRVFFLNLPEDSVRERLSMRRLDPVTGDRYHLLFKPPQSQEIKDRLVIHPRDSESKVTARLSLYNSYIEDLVDCYPLAQHINADQDPLTVFECIESVLIRPATKQTSPKH